MFLASNIRAKFKGVRESPLLTKPKKVEQVWDAIFGTAYKMPKCPDCGESLFFVSMEMSMSIKFNVPVSGIPPKFLRGRDQIAIVLECRHCILTINGYAEGILLTKNGDFTLERIIPVNIMRGKQDVV